jgi:hypothetical protein
VPVNSSLDILLYLRGGNVLFFFFISIFLIDFNATVLYSSIVSELGKSFSSQITFAPIFNVMIDW